MDAQHGRPQPHTGDHGVRGPLIIPREVGDVGRGAAHVEADDAVEAGGFRRLGHGHDAARRSRQDGVLAAEGVRRRQSTRRLHELQGSGLAQVSPDLVHIGAQDGRQIGVRYRGVSASDQLDQGADLMTGGNLFEPNLARDLGQPPLMGGEAPAVDQDDGDSP
ncbi:hypothetical protein D3C87_1356550 [compost metagenome]